jgi:hypothetical protein
VLAVAFLLALSSTASASGAQFQSPSHNIACGMFDGSGAGAFVRCDIAQHSWPLPTKPHRAGCSQLDFTGDLEVTAAGRGHFICAGDTLLHQGPVLAYGHSKTAGRFTCTSQTTGVTCRNRDTQHGFVLSKQRYRRF